MTEDAAAPPSEARAGSTDDDLIAALIDGPLYRFADLPDVDVPAGAIGVYTIWQGAEFVYVGLAGRALDVLPQRRRMVARRRGLRERLASHVSGARSDDTFCMRIGDRFVLPSLTPDQIAAIAAGHIAFDCLIGFYVRQYLTFRFVAFRECSAEALATAARLERVIRTGATSLGKPLLNPL